MEPIFRVAQIVQLKVDPSRSGPVLEILPPVGDQRRYRVFHSPTQIRDYYEDQLMEAETPVGPRELLETLLQGQWLDAATFRARLTAARLSHPQIDSLYTLQAARIQYIPFQFKPLLRFLRADRPRLLIADEVGVGKTIEAGLILKELETRQHLDNVLIVCPKALVSKWRSEMRRFDEDFRALDGQDLGYCLHETHLDGVWPSRYSRSIAHLELLRSQEYLTGTVGRRARPGFLTLDPAPHFDLVIVDEAHHLRNPESHSYELARFLCDAAEAVLFLSATPIHLKSQNLYTLLNLLRQDLFPAEAVFQEVTEPNRYVNQAIRHIRHKAPQESWQVDAFQALQDVAATSWGRQVVSGDRRFSDWYQRLQVGPEVSDSDRVRCMRDLEEVHTLANVMNRTRRRDIGRFTLRDPNTISVPFTPEQQRFYEAVIEFRREMLLQEHDPRVVRLITDTLERQASSCLPALVPVLNSFIRTGRFATARLSDDIENEEEDMALPDYMAERVQELRASAAQLPPGDPKLSQLMGIIRNAMETSGPGKVLVFSFFLHTLSYLEGKIREAGYRVATVTGQVADEDREVLRNRFRLPRAHEEALDVLLSSEVGCEGLDYEFCDRLANYDIPWNPMRIEQRIGRIDRFGQQSEKVLIFNFVTPGTVEERIFFRCFDRLGIFRDTVGDLEEVLGDMVQDLTRIALDPKLSPAQAELKAQQMADNAIRKAEEQRRLEEEGASILGLDDVVASEMDALVKEGRFVSPEELRHMIERFLEQPELGGRITPTGQDQKLLRLRMNRDGRSALLERVAALGRVDRPTVALTRWLQGADPFLTVTFDQATAVEERDVPFITPVHPLARVAVRHWGNHLGQLTSLLSVRDASLPPGRYLFICELWETIAVRPEVRLVGHVWDLDGRRHVPELSSQLIAIMGSAGEAQESPPIAPEAVEHALQQLDEIAYAARQEALTALRDRNDNLLDRKLGSLEVYHRNRMQRAQAERDHATNELIVRMKESELARIQREYETTRRDLEQRRKADILSHRVAAGVLLVQGEAPNA